MLRRGVSIGVLIMAGCWPRLPGSWDDYAPTEADPRDQDDGDADPDDSQGGDPDQEDSEDPAPDDEDCDDGIDNDDDGETDCDDSECASHPACEDDYFVPEYFWIEGGFAYFADSGEAGGATFYIDAEGDYYAYVMVTMANADYASTDSEQDVCSVLMEYDGPDRPTQRLTFTESYEDAWGDVQQVTLEHTVFRLPPDGVNVRTDCSEDYGKRELDPSWGDADDVAAWDWGVGIGEIRADIYDVLVDAGVEDYYIGGGMYWDGLPTAPPYTAAAATVAFEMSAEGELTIEENQYLVPLWADEALTDSGPVTAFYRVYGAAAYDADDLR